MAPGIILALSRDRRARKGQFADMTLIAAAIPDDIDARMWIARLQALTGQPEHAVAVYRSILAVQPQQVDALIGVGDALVTLGHLDEAADALNRAEALAAER